MLNFSQFFVQVWNHFDAGTCPGKAVGVRIRLDNGVQGFIAIKNLSDSPVINPAERVQQGNDKSVEKIFTFLRIVEHQNPNTFRFQRIDNGLVVKQFGFQIISSNKIQTI